MGTPHGYGRPYGYRGLYGVGHLGYTSFRPGYLGLGLGYWGFGYYGHGYPLYGYPYYGPGYGYYGPGYGGGYYGSYGPDETGRVRIVGAPRDAAVYVDGYYVGVVDNYDGVFQRLDLEAGAHRMEIRALGYAPATVDILVQPGRTVTYRPDLQR